MTCRKIVFAILLIVLVEPFSTRDYMQEAPEFFESCELESPEFNQCYRNNLQNLLVNFKDGIPELPTFGKLEPVEIRKLKIRQDQLKIEMRNVSIQGLSATNLTKLLHNAKNLSFLLKANIPKIRLDANYKIFGNFLFFQFNGTGKMWFEIENANFTFILKMKLHDDAETGLTFTDLQAVKSKIKNISDFRIELKNLFNGNEELEAITNDLINENWRDVIEMLRPTLEHTIDAVVFERFSKVFKFIPAKHLIADAPTAKDFYN